MICTKDLKKGDILKNTEKGYTVRVDEVGQGNSRWIKYTRMDNGDKVKAYSSKFNELLKDGAFVK